MSHYTNNEGKLEQSIIFETVFDLEKLSCSYPIVEKLTVDDI